MDFQHSSENNLQARPSRKEMFEISNEISNCFSSDVSVEKAKVESITKLSRAELLEVSQKISLYYAPKRISNSQKLVVLPIDPQHLYVYWNLGKNQAPSLSQKLANNELSLRVFLQSEGKRPWYETAIHEFQAGKTIKLRTAEKATVYSASIGSSGLDNNFVSLLKSNKTYAFQAKEEDKPVRTSDTYENTRFINFVKEDGLYRGISSVVSCFASTNHSANGKKI
jgi:hypothetical protein